MIEEITGMDYMLHAKSLKIAALFENTVELAKAISSMMRQLPKVKARRNVFIKTYHRRPMNKGKKAKVMCQIDTQVVYTSIQNRMILSQPIPKFAKGTIELNKGPEYISSIKNFDAFRNVGFYKPNKENPSLKKPGDL